MNKFNQLNIKCSAGLDYCFIKYNGNIYKCNAHSCLDKYQIGSIKDYNYPNNPNKFCENYCCKEICDKQITQQWINNKKINNPQWLPWEENDLYENINQDNYHIHAELIQGCINKCEYCGVFKAKQFQFKYIDKSYWNNFLKHIHDTKKGMKVFNICGGGEQVAHPQFNDIFEYATELNYKVNLVTSGLNFSNKFYTFDLSKLYIIISLHPLSPLWNKEKIETLFQLLRDKEAPYISCNLVTYPKNMEYYEGLKNMCDKYNIELKLFDYDPNH